ncbi:MAG: 16S rRNA (guanine(527)-N(7))-methyltransferase RsmG [Alphaproteobacteria bacterium]|nr:16S rRNA (guanine(527)-N(7))-methyltransferase RsmG [Alphaproteobacteria bacterium]
MTTDKLINQFISLLKFWNKKVNLIHVDTMRTMQQRHIEDCAQLKNYIDPSHTVLDIGSGAGFPGIILSICGFKNVILCEKDFRKSVFLKDVKRQLKLDFTVFNGDIYQFDTSKISTPITAVSRAYGSLSDLLDIMDVLKISTGVFNKGSNYRVEINEAKQKFNFHYQDFQSITDIQGRILKIVNVTRYKNLKKII